MFAGFNLEINKKFFESEEESFFKYFEEIGEKHLGDQKKEVENSLNKYISRLQKIGQNMLAMPMRLNETKSTIEAVVEYVKEWVIMANNLYKNRVLQRMEQEQMDKEQQRLEEIRKLEQENEIKDFLSSLQ